MLARLMFWARWRLGEPIIVRGVKVWAHNSGAYNRSVESAY
jgi:hypothetical protein